MITIDSLKFQDKQMEDFMREQKRRRKSWRSSIFAPTIAVVIGLAALVSIMWVFTR